MKGKSSFQHGHLVRDFILKYGIYVGAVLIFIIFSIVCKNFLSLQNFKNILDQYAYFVVCAMGMFFVVMIGGVDLSCGGLIAFSSVIGTSIMIRTKSVAMGCILIIAICTIAGIINALSVAKLGIPAFIATLAFDNIWRGSAYTYTSAQSVSGLPAGITGFYFTKILGMRGPTVLMLAVFLVLFYLLTFTG